jgi:hypothetical protein
MSNREGEQPESVSTESQASASLGRNNSAIEEVYGTTLSGTSDKKGDKSHSSDKADQGSSDNQLGGFHREYIEDMAKSGVSQGSASDGRAAGARAADKDVFGKMPNIYEKKQGGQQEKVTSLGEKAANPYADIGDGAKQAPGGAGKSSEDSDHVGKNYREMVDRARQAPADGEKPTRDSDPAGKTYREMVDRAHAEGTTEDAAGKTYREMVDRARQAPADGEKPTRDSDPAGKTYREMVDRARQASADGEKPTRDSDPAGKTYRNMVDKARAEQNFKENPEKWRKRLLGPTTSVEFKSKD